MKSNFLSEISLHYSVYRSQSNNFSRILHCSNVQPALSRETFYKCLQVKHRRRYCAANICGVPINLNTDSHKILHF